MEIILKYACSLDGFLDDINDKPCLFSSDEDKDSVDKLRASSDAILVGGKTLREDNPALKIRSADNRKFRKLNNFPEQPFRLCLSNSGDFSPKLQFFDNSSDSYILSPSIVSDLKKFHKKINNNSTPEQILQVVDSLGVSKLLIEGGWNLHQQFLVSTLPVKLRISIAPIFLGNLGKTRVDLAELLNLKLIKQQQLGENTVLWLEK